MKLLGSKSGNFCEYEGKRLQHRFVGFLEKSENLAYICEKCKLIGAFLAGERFDSVFWKNKVDGTQNLTYNGKMMPKVLGPTSEKNGKLEKLIFDYIMI